MVSCHSLMNHVGRNCHELNLSDKLPGPLGYERVYLPLCKVADTPFHIQGDHTRKDVRRNNSYWFFNTPPAVLCLLGYN